MFWLCVLVLVVLALAMLGTYLYGVNVGMDAGEALGRKAADREWAIYFEHGATPAPEAR
jgi:hypothetical protein